MSEEFEIRKEVKVVLVNRLCPRCGIVLYATGELLTSNPPQYKHKCYSCEKEYVFRKSYPYPEYKEC